MAIKTFQELSTDQKKKAAALARQTAVDKLINIMVVVDPSDATLRTIHSDVGPMDKTKLLEIHDSVSDIDMAYVVGEVFADATLRTQFANWISSIASGRQYSIPDTYPDPSKETVELT